MADVDNRDLVRQPSSNRRRPNMADRRSESWRPPLFGQTTTPMRRLAASVRRFLDLQSCSIWRDIKAELVTVHGTLLDVGCGAQPYRELVNPDVRYIGLDTADAKDRFGYEIPDTVYFTGTVWPIDSDSVDAILCTETLEHVLEPMELLNEAARCLHPGGRIILTVPFSARWHFIPFDYWRYTPPSLKYLLERAGFQDVIVYARGNALTVACYKNMALFIQPLLQPGSGLVGIAARIISVLFLPLVILLALLAQLSLRAQEGDDCLGYTVLATRSRTAA